MTNLPSNLKEKLYFEPYIRKDKTSVVETLNRLEVKVSDTFIEFYENYSGPFWEEKIAFELLDLIEESHRNIETYTNICREEHGLPNKFLVISEMIVLSVLILDTETDKVYKVDFEGGYEELLEGSLEESWPSFYDFLLDYFQ